MTHEKHANATIRKCLRGTVPLTTSIIALSQDITVQMLKTGMMKKFSAGNIKKKIDIFITPTQTKTHGRPIYRENAQRCNLNIASIPNNDSAWDVVYELHRRLDTYVSSSIASKCIESKDHSFFTSVPESDED